MPFCRTPVLILSLTLVAHAQALLAAAPASQPATGPARLAIPEEAAQDRAQLMIVNLFKADYAKTSAADRQALARKLLSQAAETRDDATARYVLLQDADELASLAGDPVTAYAAATEIARLYQADTIDLKKKTLFRANASDATPAASEALAREALDTADDAALLDDFASVQQLVNLAESAANKTRNVPFVSSIQQRLFDLRSLIADYPKVQQALKKLADSSSDAEDHLLVGKFYALRKGQWDVGLPHLAQGSDAALRTVATQDLARPTDGLKQATLGDAWWDFAQTLTPANGAARRHTEDRAREWYRLAKPNLAGLTLTRIQARLQNSTSEPAGTSAAAVGGNTVNLLPLVDPAKDTLDGKWAFANNALHCIAPTRNALLALPYDPTDEYDLRLTFIRTEGDGAITILLPSHNKLFDFALDIKGDGRFERVANKIARDNPTAAPVVITNNRRYVLTLQIHKDIIRALLDDKPITQWKTDYKDLSHYAIWKVPNDKRLAIGVNNSKVAFLEIQITELAGKGHPAR